MYYDLPLKIALKETLVKLGDREHYCVRVITLNPTSSQPTFAVAATRSEDHNEVHLLSAAVDTPLEAVRMLMAGFFVRNDASPRATDIVAYLVQTGAAAWLTDVEKVA